MKYPIRFAFFTLLVTAGSTAKVTLWRPSAFNYHTQEEKLDPHDILHLMDKLAEEAWGITQSSPIKDAVKLGRV